MRSLRITETQGIWKVENWEGMKGVGSTLEKALDKLAHNYGFDWSGGDIRSGFEAADVLDALCGRVHTDGGQIHDGPVTG